MTLKLILNLLILTLFGSFMFGKVSALDCCSNKFNFDISITGRLVDAFSQDEWLDRYDLIEDDWYYNPPAADEGSAVEDGDIHNEL